jgi:hypothetical protein
MLQLLIGAVVGVWQRNCACTVMKCVSGAAATAATSANLAGTISDQDCLRTCVARFAESMFGKKIRTYVPPDAAHQVREAQHKYHKLAEALSQRYALDLDLALQHKHALHAILAT